MLEGVQMLTFEKLIVWPLLHFPTFDDEPIKIKPTWFIWVWVCKHN